jgi:hypothetical protein
MFLAKILEYSAVRWVAERATAGYAACKEHVPALKGPAAKAEGVVGQMVARVAKLPVVSFVDAHAAEALKSAERVIAASRDSIAVYAAAADAALGLHVDSALQASQKYVPEGAKPIVARANKLADEAIAALLPTESEAADRPSKTLGVYTALAKNSTVVQTLRRRTAGKSAGQVAVEAATSTQGLVVGAYKKMPGYGKAGVEWAAWIAGWSMAVAFSPLYIPYRVFAHLKSSCGCSCSQPPAAAEPSPLPASSSSVAPLPTDK